MRRKVTLNLDDEWITMIDEARGRVPRSRYIEDLTDQKDVALAIQLTRDLKAAMNPAATVERLAEENTPTPKAQRSPGPHSNSERRRREVMDEPKIIPEVWTADAEKAKQQRIATAKEIISRSKPALQRPIIQKREK